MSSGEEPFDLPIRASRAPRRAQSFVDGRDGHDRWGRERKHLIACGEDWEHVCCAPETLVLTATGYRPIAEIAVGDLVLTHKGRWRPAIALTARPATPTVRVRAHGVPGLRVTPDHLFWARPRGPRYVAGDYATGLRKPRRRRDSALGARWTQAADLHAHYVAGPLPPTRVDHQPLEWWWLVGRWLGDGHFERGGRERGGAVVISCHHEEAAGLARHLGDRAGYTRRGTATSIRVRDPDGTLRRLLRDCGHGAGGKRLPRRLLELPAEQASAVLDGYWSADGNYQDRLGWRASTISRPLALGMAALAQRAYGRVMAVRAGRPPRAARIEGRAVNCRQEWLTALPPNDTRAHSWCEDNTAWKMVRRIEAAGSTVVYDLAVEEDESFVAEGAAVHNCPAYREESCPGEFNKGDRLMPLRVKVCNLACAECGGGGRVATHAYCSHGARGDPMFESAVAEMGGTLRMDAWTSRPSGPALKLPGPYVPVVERYAKAFGDKLTDLPAVFTTTQSAMSNRSDKRRSTTVRERLGDYSGLLGVCGLVKDDLLDDQWDDRHRQLRYLRDSEVDLMVVPQFSYYDADQSCMALYNSVRHLAFYHLCREMGFEHVALDVPQGAQRWLHEEYMAFCARSQVTMIAMSMQTLGLRGSLDPRSMVGLRWLQEDLADDVAVLIFGLDIPTAQAQATRLLRGRDVTFLSKGPYAHSIFFELLPQGATAPKGWTRADVFAHNVRGMERVAQRSGRGGRQSV